MIRSPGGGLALDLRRGGASKTPFVLGLAVLANLLLALALASGHAQAVVVLFVVVATIAVAATMERFVLLVVMGFNCVSSVVFSIVAVSPVSFGSLQLYPQDIALLLVLGGWIAWELGRAPAGSFAPALRRFAREPVVAPFVAFLVFVTIAMARSGLDSLNSARPFLYAVLAVAVYRLVTTERDLRDITAVIVAGATVTSAYGLFLLAAGRNITDADLSTGGTRGVAISASYLVGSAFVCVVASRVAGAGRFPRVWPVLLLVLGGGLLASGARQTWLGVIVALAVFAILSPVRGVLRMVAALLAVGAIALAAYTLLPSRATIDAKIQDFTSRASADTSQDYSAQDRVIKWHVVWDEVKERPLFGTGFGATFTYTTNFSSTGNNFKRTVADDPENSHLWLWARTGTLGFLAWVWLNVTGFLVLVRRFLETRSPLVGSIALWGIGTFIVIWSGMTFSPVSSFRSTLLVFWTLFALGPILREMDRRAERP